MNIFQLHVIFILRKGNEKGEKEMMNIKEVALEVYENEGSKLSFNKWLEIRIEEGRLTLEEAIECGYVMTISKTQSKVAQIAAETKEENDFSFLVEELSKSFPMSYIRKLVSHLNKKEIGKVTNFDLELSGRNLVGIIIADKVHYKIWNTTCQSSTGKQHTRLVISEIGGM